MTLEDDISGMEINPGDFIHVQFRDKNPKPLDARDRIGWHLRNLSEKHHILKQNAFFGTVIDVGKDVSYLVNPVYDDESKARVAENVREAQERMDRTGLIIVNTAFDPLELDFHIKRTDDPDLYDAIEFLYDAKDSRWGISYTTETGHRILINGVVLKEVDKGVTGLDVVTDHFPKNVSTSP